jgi:hypothetical protein
MQTIRLPGTPGSFITVSWSYPKKIIHQSKKNIMKKGKITILMPALVLFVLSVVFANAAFADCTYVSIDKGKVTKMSIPNDFPVQLSTGNPAADQENFEKAIAEWRIQHPELSDLDMTPPLASGRFIQISKDELENFSPEKRQAILVNSSFYQIIQ